MTRPSDRCPGVFTTHPGADGRVARVRLPGGLIEPAQMQALAEFARDHGDGFLEMTGRANLQVRGLGDEPGVAALIESGLVPSAEHDRVRNLMVSPRAGRIAGHHDVRELSERVDRALRDDDTLAELPGRFLFGFDDGSGDVVAHSPDVGVRAVDRDRVEILLAGEPTGLMTSRDGAADLVVDVARSFLRARRDEWRMTDLDPDSLAAVRAEVADRTTNASIADEDLPAVGNGPLVGWFDQADGTVMLGCVVPLGRIPARTAEFLAAIDRPIILTPDREILICDMSDGAADAVLRVLAPMGVIFDASSPWARVSACAGAPGCARSHADVRGDLTDHVESGAVGIDREHWVGCDRGCGTPHAPHVRVQAGVDGYERLEQQGLS